MSPIAAEEALYNDLQSIYARAGAEVTYETDEGKRKAYWPKRFLQALKRAKTNGEVQTFVERLVQASEPSRGFFILKKEERLDLTVEALVIDKEKPYWGVIEHPAVEASRRRLADHGYPHAFGTPPMEDQTVGDDEDQAQTGEIQLVPGTSFDLRVTVGEGGKLSFSIL
jgi:hypothetical protein